MRTTTIIAALVLASVGASAQTEAQRDWIDPQEREDNPPTCHSQGGYVSCDARTAPIVVPLDCPAIGDCVLGNEPRRNHRSNRSTGARFRLLN